MLTALTAGLQGDLTQLCAQELVLDRQADAIPGILARRPHIALAITHDAALLGASIGSVVRRDDGGRDGVIDLVVVARPAQRRGIGSELIAAMESRLAGQGCDLVAVAGNGPYYAWPGIDLHYTAAVCLAEDLGYRRQGCEVNMDVDLLVASLDCRADLGRLAAAGIAVRRAGPEDDGPLQESLAATWQAGWITEVAAALRSSEAGLYVAVTGSRYAGFCAYGLNRAHEVGPVGVAPDLRRLGVGAALLRSCLAELRGRGQVAAELVWAGPLSFFSRTVGATIGRAFWQYEKNLTGGPPGPDWRDRIGLL